MIMEESEESCFIFLGWKNSTARNIIPLGYEGIPQNLVLNVCGCIIMIIIFSVLRKKAWNYGRIAFDHRLDRTYTDVLFGGTSHERRNPESPTRFPRDIFIDDSGLFSWILTVFRLTDEQIRAKSGEDAVHYLSFQRHLIFIAVLVMVVSIIIVLPINFQGNVKSSASEFQSSTIKNLGESGKLLWVHAALSLSYLFVTVAVLRHFSKTLAFAEGDRDPIMSRTVMISRIAKKHSQSRDAGLLENHFIEIYPDVEIDEISFAYNITRLQNAESCKTAAASARAYWEDYVAIKGKRPTMRPYTCGKLLCCCIICGLKSVDAIDYYKKEEERYTELAEKERQRALSLPLGIAFVTFKTTDMCRRVVSDYRLSARCFKLRPVSAYSSQLKSNRWIVSHAPFAEDLYWENLSVSYQAWYAKALLVNIVLIILVIVYSTPVFILNTVNKELKLKEGVSRLGGLATGGLATDTAPTMLLWITAVTLPSLVSVSDRIVGFWTKTAENRSRMVKTFTFLLFMVIILPSLGLQSILGHIYAKKLSLKCIFYTGNGVFFVNYVITSSFLGTASELMRLHELFYYAVKLCFAKSSAEIDSVRKSVLWDFQFGSQYAWTMLNFTMFVIFSLICPIITPFGFVYVVMKHYVDRYNIYFAYAPCKVEKEVHKTAINFVVVTFFLLQIIMLAYINVYQDDSNKLLKVFSILGFCLTAAFFIGQIFFNFCTNFSPISYQKMECAENGGASPASTALTSSGNNEDGTSHDTDQLDEVSYKGSTYNNLNEELAVITTAPPPVSAVIVQRRKYVLKNEKGKYFPKILRSESTKKKQNTAPAELVTALSGSTTTTTTTNIIKQIKQKQNLTTDVTENTRFGALGGKGENIISSQAIVSTRNGHSPTPV